MPLQSISSDDIWNIIFTSLNEKLVKCNNFKKISLKFSLVYFLIAKILNFYLLKNISLELEQLL